MYSLFFILVPVLIVGLSIFLHIFGISIYEHESYNNYKTAIVSWSAVAFSIFIIFVVSSFCNNSNQVDNYLKIEQLEKQKKILTNKAEYLSKIFENALVKKYPAFEKEIFSGMKTEDLKMLFIKYPEIKTSITTISFVDKIDKLESDIYKKELLIQEYVQQCKFRKNNPWLYTSLIKDFPENLKMYFKDE